jgi:hypothetical protein
MEEIKARKLIELFYKQLPEEYSHLSFKQVNEICRAPWSFLKKIIYVGDFEKIRFKYFGLWSVRLGRAKAGLREKIATRKRHGDDSPYKEFYDEQIKNLNKFLEKNELDTNQETT